MNRNKQSLLFERVYFECNIKPLKEAVIIEAGRIYIQQAESDIVKNIDELWRYYENYAKQRIINNESWKTVTINNTDPPLTVEIYSTCINEILSHTAKQEQFRPKILCLQALPKIIQNINHITQEKENKKNLENEYWYYGSCHIIIDGIPYIATVKLVKRRDRTKPRLYVYFLNDLRLKKVD